LIRLIAPIIVFTAEEIWQSMPKRKSDKIFVSVHLLEFPKVNPLFAQHDLASSGKQDINQELEVIIELIPDVAKALEEKRTKGAIGSSFDAEIKLLTNDEDRYKFLASSKSDLCEIFKVSQVDIQLVDNLEGVLLASKYPDIAIEVDKAKGDKCIRCWNYSLEIGENKNHPLLCNQCCNAVGG
jgi:isoleucyl-tRNA synthetase